MRKMLRVALLMGLMTMSAVSVEAKEVHEPDDAATTQVLVVNNYVTDVRVYIEDAEGRLHHMGRLARGSLTSFDVPDGLTRGEFRVKVYPAALPGSRFDDNEGVKTNALLTDRDRQVRVWLEADLPSSIVEIERG